LGQPSYSKPILTSTRYSTISPSATMAVDFTTSTVWMLRTVREAVATEAAVRGQLAELGRRAREEGAAVAIGHPYPATLAVLEAELPGLAAKGVRLVRVGELVK